MPNIEPRTLKGFRDFLPEQQIARQKMMDSIRASYESFGFEPLETPALEYADILTGKYGDEGDKLMYRFKDNGDRDVALRYDLTIPLARVVAQYENDIKKPWKRYQMSPVWRAENTQKGRFREFYQCDADIVGTTSPLADAEILALGSSALRGLGVKDFTMRVNSREVIAAFYESLGFSAEQQIVAMRAVDKIDKIGREGVEKELAQGGFDAGKSKAIVEFAAMRMGDVEDLSVALKAFPMVADSLGKLAGIVKSALILAPDTKIVIDFSIARGLDYYTGLIVETNLDALPQFGSIFSGGRYDNLVGMFSKRPVPAVGASIGLDRLIAALEELKLVEGEKSTADVLIVNFGEEFAADYLKMASDLRNAGINTILYFDAADLKKQLGYASEKGIRRVVMYGENEAKAGKVIIKDLEKGTQDTVDLSDLNNSFTV